MIDALSEHIKRVSAPDLTTLATARLDRPALSAAGWTVDLTRQRIDAEAEAALIDWGAGRGLGDAIQALFAGDIVNPSEGRPALHWALRAGASLAGEADAVRRSLEAPLAFARSVRSGEILAADGAPFTAIVHIGIGGSDFGPRLIADTFHAERSRSFDLRFAANLDPLDLDLALEGLDPARTLVIGVSKSFGTEETLYNLDRARAWLAEGLGASAGHHLALVTANPERASAWVGDGSQPHLFDMPLSVGGRFSLWSAASLACFISIGPERIEAFLAGAAEMDAHVKTAALEENLAVRLALMDVWNTSALGFPMRVVLAYARRLRFLPTYLQQLEMESNGKSAGPDGTAAPFRTAPAVWGGEGSIGQHSYHQWLHQGTEPVPAEFILALDAGGDITGKRALMAHALAQAEVLANGRSLAEIQAEEPDLSDAVARQKVHAGGRPSTVLSCDRFDAAKLGALIALYEHRTYLAGVLWGVNSFDQWGVERGKTMAGRLKPVLEGAGEADDPVTAALAARIMGGL
ncbi:MAG: glucose-6-phosphate isomerase [Pseudomonadota bacterium]